MTTRHRPLWIIVIVLVLVSAAGGAGATNEDDVRSLVERFVVAQNAHDIAAVADLLWDSPQFLWITRGAPIWGREAALARFQALYKGTWMLEPELNDLKVTLFSDGVASVYVPVVFSIGAAGQDAQKTRFLLNQIVVRTPAGWKVSRILPIPAAPR